MEDNMGPRLENLLWRILRSQRVFLRMSGTRLAKHVENIADGGYIRTTPTASPRASRNLDNYNLSLLNDGTQSSVSSSRRRPPPVSSRTAIFAPEQHSEDEGTPTPKSTSPFARVPVAATQSVQKRRSNLGRLPPILKKNNNGSGGSSGKGSSVPSPSELERQMPAATNQLPLERSSSENLQTASRASTSAGGSPLPRRLTATRFSEEVRVLVPKEKSTSKGIGEKSPRSRTGSYTKSNKRNPVVRASAGSSKKRPILMRQRSSMTSQEGSLPDSAPMSRQASEEGTPAETEDSDLSIAPGFFAPSRRRSGAPERRPRQGSDQASTESKNEKRSSKINEDHKIGDEEEEEEREARREEKTHTGMVDLASSAKTSRSQLGPGRNISGFLPPSQHRSFTNLPAAAWRSSAAAPTAASYQAAGFMAPDQGSASTKRSRTAFRDDIVPLKAPGPSIDDSLPAAATTAQLPRTKSQLALLLERSKTALPDKKGKKSDQN